MIERLSIRRPFSGDIIELINSFMSNNKLASYSLTIHNKKGLSMQGLSFFYLSEEISREVLRRISLRLKLR